MHNQQNAQPFTYHDQYAWNTKKYMLEKVAQNT